MSDYEQISRLLHSEICDSEGEHAGHVRDVLIDVVDGRVEYVLVALPPAGLRRIRYVTVPWSVFGEASDVDGQCHVKVRRATLERLANREPHAPVHGGKHSSM